MELINASDSEKLYSTLQGEEIDFAIGDPAIIIELVRSKIYAHPVRTLVQEYLSNALDAHQETRAPASKMKVTLPTSLNPVFSIRDYGPGMDHDRVKNVFTKYGLSTKRKEKKQLGCFGIGGKIAWAYTDAFTIEVWHDGKHTQYLAEIGERREGRLTVMGESLSSEPPGVLVQVAVAPKDFEMFRDSYTRATWLWPSRPTLEYDPGVTYPEPITKLKDVAIYDFKSSPFSPGVYLDVGGIPYDIQADHEQTNKFNLSYKAVVIKADPLKLGVSASRESYSNRAYSDSLVEKALKQLQAYVEKEVATADLAQLRDKLKTLHKTGLQRYYKHSGTNNEYEVSATRVKVVGGGFYQKRFDQYSRSREKKFFSFQRSFGDQHEFSTEDPIYYAKYKTKNEELTSLNDLDLRTRLSIQKSKNDHHRLREYIFLQGTMSDQAYRDVCILLGITEAYEDKYPVERKEKSKTTPLRELSVRRWDDGVKGKLVSVEHVLSTYDYVFYTDSDIEAAKYSHMSKLHKKKKMIIVSAQPKVHEFLDDTYLNYLPVEEMPGIFKEDKEWQDAAALAHAWHCHRNLYTSLRTGKLSRLKFKNLDLNKVLEKFSDKHYCSLVDGYNVYNSAGILFPKLATELDYIADNFPILDYVADNSCYNISVNFPEHLQLYIDAIERKLDEDSRNDKDSDGKDQGEAPHDPENGSEILGDSNCSVKKCVNG